MEKTRRNTRQLLAGGSSVRSLKNQAGQHVATLCRETNQWGRGVTERNRNQAQEPLVLPGWGWGTGSRPGGGPQGIETRKHPPQDSIISRKSPKCGTCYLSPLSAHIPWYVWGRRDRHSRCGGTLESESRVPPSGFFGPHIQ